MKTLYIRGIPDEDQKKLEEKAKKEGLKLTAFCRVILLKIARNEFDITGEIKKFFT